MTNFTTSRYKFQLPSFLSTSPQQLVVGKYRNTAMTIRWRAASLFSIYECVLSLTKIRNFLTGRHSVVINLLTNKNKFLNNASWNMTLSQNLYLFEVISLISSEQNTKQRNTVTCDTAINYIHWQFGKEKIKDGESMQLEILIFE